MYQVGNGKELSIREDRWLKTGPIGGPATGNEPLLVADLIEQDTGKWNTEKVEAMFGEGIVQEILATPIGVPNSKDKQVWLHTKSGIYSAKSGYFSARGNSANHHTTAATSSHQTNPDLWKHI